MTRPVDAIAALGEPTRRRLYEVVARAGASVSRDQAAAAAGTTRALAAFHLDKLVEAGLLAVEYRRVSGRSGPGAGRPAKLYRRAAEEVAVSLPPRSYDLGGALLADALAATRSTAARAALARTARERGRALGGTTPLRAGASRKARRDAVLAALTAQGYEPVVLGDEIRLRNCPFHALAERQRTLVCGMNLSLLEGLLEGLAAADYEARLAPEPGWCCVAFRRRGS
jgi:predicted ArsR family transcriptional regulator